jgi:quercetin dioxygenase-like cupin family protein
MPASGLSLRGPPRVERILLAALRERRAGAAADRRLRVRPPGVREHLVRLRRCALSALGHTHPPPRHRTRVRGTGALREVLPYYRWGLAAGLLGAFVVAVFFLVLDLANGRPLATPNALGAAVFLGEPFDLAREVSWTLVAGYTAVHGGLFLGLALVVSAWVLGSPRPPPAAPQMALILTGSFFGVLTLLYIAGSLVESASLAAGMRIPLVLSANLLAATAMALLLTYAFQTRWRTESPLVPPVGQKSAAEPHRAQHRSARDRLGREGAVDREWFHLFSLAQFARELREEREYAEHGRNGIALLKSDRVRVVLEVAAEGAKIAEHTVEGAAMITVLDGALDVACNDERRVARAGELVVIPHDRPRTITAKSDASFLWTLFAGRMI